MLALFGTETEPMGWGVTPDDLRPYFPPDARVELLADTGHFIHIEQPRKTAELVLEHLRT
jgi:pimeloyl-ACP methyl ester carboxylesterase